MEGQKLDYSYARGSKPDILEPRYLHLLGAGSTNCSERTMEALAYQPMGLTSTQIRKLMADIKEMSQYLFQTKNPLTLSIQASGIGGMESVLNSLMDSGEKVIIATGGYWGELCAEVARRLRLDVVELKLKNAAEPYTLEELETELKTHEPSLLFITHAESSTGLVQPLEGLGPLCHKYNCLLAVDAVVSLGTEPLFVDRWEVDVAAAATQKGVGAPPGMCLLTLNSRAQKKMMEKKEKACYYLDIKSLADYWECLGGTFKYGVSVIVGIGPTQKETMIRLGMLAYNAREEVLNLLVDSLKKKH